ncbi:hypothetical protein AALO_G00014710 [Alosa alosa]|uniref:Uncharacterized protein n=1 Tax=Alosa alosa TaxID=278164 RepID=A0AAV6HHA2_9TELE|nr:hypothetical protein AALO_G00014710 [Alosa alosa]
MGVLNGGGLQWWAVPAGSREDRSSRVTVFLTSDWAAMCQWFPDAFLCQEPLDPEADKLFYLTQSIKGPTRKVKLRRLGAKHSRDEASSGARMIRLFTSVTHTAEGRSASTDHSSLWLPTSMSRLTLLSAVPPSLKVLLVMGLLNGVKMAAAAPLPPTPSGKNMENAHPTHSTPLEPRPLLHRGSQTTTRSLSEAQHCLLSRFYCKHVYNT